MCMPDRNIPDYSPMHIEFVESSNSICMPDCNIPHYSPIKLAGISCALSGEGDVNCFEGEIFELSILDT